MYAQVAAACADAPSCFTYNLARRVRTIKRLRTWPGVVEATQQLGYDSVEPYLEDAADHYEAIYLLSTFCLSPPGDTFTRRGFWDALLVGCIPVVFDDRSRYWPTFFEFGDARAVSVLLPAAELAANETVLEEHLRAYLPLVPAMQRAIAQQATGFQWAFSDLSEEEHAAVGPDALDIALHSLSARASSARCLTSTSMALGAELRAESVARSLGSWQTHDTVCVGAEGCVVCGAPCFAHTPRR